jgi:hypothetical protein
MAICITHVRNFLNLKCKEIIEIPHAQTHQLCTYNFVFTTPFLWFVDGGYANMIGVSALPFLYPWLLLTQS